MVRMCTFQHVLSYLQLYLQEDHMPSYFLAETCKYAFLIANSTFLAVRALPRHRLSILFCASHSSTLP